MDINLEFMKETFWVAVSGIPVTLKLTFIPLLLSAPIAFFLALSKINKTRILWRIVTVYVSFVRGTPIVLQILLIYSLLPSVLNLLIKELQLPWKVFDINPIVYAYTVFTLNTVAILSETFRSALQTVSKGQLEAAQSAGLSNVAAYIRIIIPQALVAALPNICTITVNLLKSTSLAFLMTVKDVTAVAKMEASYGYNYIEAYIDIFFVYLIICMIVQVLFKGVEKYFSSFKAYSH